MPRCLRVYQLLDDGPKTPQQLALLIDKEDRNGRYVGRRIHAWIAALEECGLIYPVGLGYKPADKRGLFPILWARTDKRRAPERRPCSQAVTA